MGAIKDFRIQTGVPTTPPQGVVGLYANASGVLVTQQSGAAPIQLGSVFTGVVSYNSIPTGQKQNNSGVWYAGTNNGAILTGLANPSFWLPVSYSGQNFAIPAYLLL